MLTQEKLQEILWYCSVKGEFYWKTSDRRGWDGRPAGCTNDQGYWRIKIGKKYYRRGRLAWLYVYATWPTEIDHINLDKSDDRIDNLREVTRAQNQQNRTLHKSNKTGYKGVWEIKNKNKNKNKNKKKQVAPSYVARAKGKHLGVYKTPEEAHLAYQKAATQMYGAYARW